MGDEVIEEAEDEDVSPPSAGPHCCPAPPNSAVLSPTEKRDEDDSVDTTISSVMLDNINQLMMTKRISLGKLPVGLAGSRYASIAPNIMDVPTCWTSQRRLLSMKAEKETPPSKEGGAKFRGFETGHSANNGAVHVMETDITSTVFISATQEISETEPTNSTVR